MKEDKLTLSAIIVILCVILLWLTLGKFILPEHKISIQKTRQGAFRLLVERKPFLIKGVVYQPTPIGKNHQYNFWADKNLPWREDGRLMQKMGVNTVRFFQPGTNAGQTRQVIRELYQQYGIRTILGHWMDYWTPQDYADPKYREDLTKRVLEMVKTYKDEPGILLWILGNENNLSWHARARVPWSCSALEEIKEPYEQGLAKAKIYYSLVNQIARKIKQLDPAHPVALGNADSYSLEVARQVCPDIDLVAVTAYRGKSFGNLWREIRAKLNKPVLIMEFGCDSFNAQTGQDAQDIQSIFLQSQWEDIQRNIAGRTGEGNALGGCIFEWNDEWWKYNEEEPSGWSVHNSEASWSGGGYYFDIGAANNLNINEEWWGIVSLGPELEQGINKRISKKAYDELEKLWKVK